MARFFNPNEAPITYPSLRITGRSREAVTRPTADELKTQDIRGAYKAAQVPGYGISSATNITDSEGVEGMGLNLPTGATSTDQKKFMEELISRGRPEIAQAMETHQQTVEANSLAAKEKAFNLQNLQLKTQVEALSTASVLYRAGAKGKAVAMLAAADPEDPVTDIQDAGQGRLRFITKGTPEGDVYTQHQLDLASISSKQRLEQRGPLKIVQYGHTLVGTTTDSLGNIASVFSVDISPKAEQMPEKEKLLYAQSLKTQVEINTSRADRLASTQSLSDVSNFFASYVSAGYENTGPGMHRPDFTISNEALSLDRKFKGMNFLALMEQAKGISKAIDSDAERALFEVKQPSLFNYPIVNAQIITANVALKTALEYEDQAHLQHLQGGKYEDTYISPVLGKQQVLFSKQGIATMFSNEQVDEAKKNLGYMTATEMAAYTLTSGVSPKLGAPPKPVKTGDVDFKDLPKKRKE